MFGQCCILWQSARSKNWAKCNIWPPRWSSPKRALVEASTLRKCKATRLCELQIVWHTLEHIWRQIRMLVLLTGNDSCKNSMSITWIRKTQTAQTLMSHTAYIWELKGSRETYRIPWAVIRPRIPSANDTRPLRGERSHAKQKLISMKNAPTQQRTGVACLCSYVSMIEEFLRRVAGNSWCTLRMQRQWSHFELLSTYTFIMGCL